MKVLVMSRSARTLWSMAALVAAAVERRARVQASLGGRLAAAAGRGILAVARRTAVCGAPRSAIGSERRPLGRVDVEQPLNNNYNNMSVHVPY